MGAAAPLRGDQHYTSSDAALARHAALPNELPPLSTGHSA